MSSASASAPRRRGPAAPGAALACALALLALAPAHAGSPTGGAAVRIEGNRAVTAADLRAAAAQELGRLVEGGGQRADADDAAFRMTLAYRERGYAFAEVGYRLAAEGEAAAVVFSVEEGPRVLLGTVSVEGAAAFPRDRLRSFFPRDAGGLLGGGGEVPFVEEEVRSGAGALRNFYLDNGFLDVRVAPPRVAFREGRTRADVTVEVLEGPRHVVRAATFAGELVPEATEALLDLKREVTGKAYTPQVELTLRGRVGELYGDLGYPDAAAQVEREAGPAPGDVLLRATVTSGERVHIARVEVAGNARTRRGHILRRVPLGPGQRYRLSAVREAVRRLYATGLFSSVDLRLEGEGPERALLVEVREVPARELSLSVGWSSYERLRAGAGVRHLNLLGTGRGAGIEGSGSRKRTGVTAHLTDPRLLGTPLVATFPVSYRRDEEPSFTRRQVEIAPQVAWQLSRELSLTARYPLQFSWTGSFSEEAPAELADDNYRLARLVLQARYDSRRELFFPTRGLEATLTGEAADPALASELTFVRGIAAVRGYVSLTGSTVLALRAESGIAVPTRDELDLPLAERFFLGGERTVRSFRESRLGPLDAAGKPVGGLGYNLVGAELRQRIAGNLSAALFADVGNVSPNRSFPSLVEKSAAGTLGDGDVLDATRRDFFRDFRAGVGVGVRYLLPIGPARLDLAWNPGPRAEEEGFVAHLSVGMAF